MLIFVEEIPKHVQLAVRNLLLHFREKCAGLVALEESNIIGDEMRDDQLLGKLVRQQLCVALFELFSHEMKVNSVWEVVEKRAAELREKINLDPKKPRRYKIIQLLVMLL